MGGVCVWQWWEEESMKGELTRVSVLVPVAVPVSAVTTVTVLVAMARGAVMQRAGRLLRRPITNGEGLPHLGVGLQQKQFRRIVL